MHLHIEFGSNFTRGYKRFLEMEYRNVPERERFWHTIYAEGYKFAKGEYEKVTLRENKITLGTFTPEEFKFYFQDWIEKEVDSIKKTIQNEIDVKDRKEKREFLMKQNIHPENRNNKPKKMIQINYGNKYYMFNEKTYQVVYVKHVHEKLCAKYIEKPSNKEKEICMKFDFVVAKIMKPSGRCTEIKIPYEEFRSRKFFIDKECTQV